MSIAIKINGTVAPRSLPLPNERGAAKKTPRPRRSRKEQLRYENGLIRHLMLGSAAVVTAGYGLVMAITTL